MRLVPALVSAAFLAPLSLPSYAAPTAFFAADDAGEKQTVQVAVDDQVTLAATLYSPKSTKQPSPAALLVHDAGGSRADLKDIAERLQKQGFIVLALDLRDHGESAKEGADWTQLDDAARKVVWNAALADLKAGVTYLRSRPNVQPSSLSLVGYRTGCTLVARYAVRDESVRAIALVDPQAEQFGFNVMKDVEGLGGLPTFVVVGKGDDNQGKRLTDAAARASRTGKADDVLQVLQSKEATGETLGDKRVAPELVKWLLSRVNPQKGKS